MLKRIFDWFGKEPGWLGVVGYGFGILIIDLLYNIFVVHFFLRNYVGMDFAPSFFLFIRKHPLVCGEILIFIPFFAGRCLTEEFLFRLPLYKFVKNGVSWTTILVAVISSALFGYFHGGAAKILVQGVGGFLYCLLYLKSGGANKKILKPLLACGAVHLINNIISAILSLCV